jgi:peptide deformylase
MNTFEIIPNEQTPKVPEILDTNVDITSYIKEHVTVLTEFLENCRWKLNAAGLACNQVSLNGERFMVRAFAYVDRVDNIWRLAIDPKIIEYIGIKETRCEGCLTWKDKVIVAERSRAIDVSYYDIHGNVHMHEFHKGFGAQVFQHEINHLNGVAERIEELGFKEPRRIDVGRNDKCPCGSEKKYKNCCLLYL